MSVAILEGRQVEVKRVVLQLAPEPGSPIHLHLHQQHRSYLLYTRYVMLKKTIHSPTYTSIL